MHPALKRLQASGWDIRISERRMQLPEAITRRYPRLPVEVTDIVCGLEQCISPGEKSWLLGVNDYAGAEDVAFRWNEWEQLSLEAAGGDDSWKREIRAFWDSHFPVFMSLGSGYEYAAIRVIEPHFGVIVHGSEPDFEQPTVIARDYIEFLGKLVV